MLAAEGLGSGNNVFGHLTLQSGGAFGTQFRYHAGFGRAGFRVAGEYDQPFLSIFRHKIAPVICRNWCISGQAVLASSGSYV
jgi:hypothetical protein